MALTADERTQLDEIGAALAADDPALACRMRRMAPYSLEWLRMMAGAVGVLTLGSGMFFLLGAALGRPECLVAGALCAGGALLGACGWRVAQRRCRTAR